MNNWCGINNTICGYAESNGYCSLSACRNIKLCGNTIQEEKPNPWHTGTPPEEGWYLVKVNFEDHLYYAMKFEDGSFWDYDDNDLHFVRILPDFINKWQKIEETE